MPVDLAIVTPAHVLVETPADAVVVPGAEGEFGVLPGHERLLAPLQEGVVQYRSGDGIQRLRITGGFAEVSEERVLILADSAEPLEG